MFVFMFAPFTLEVITVSPGDTDLIMPFLSTVATEGSDEENSI